MGARFVALERDDDLFKQGAQQFLAISIARRRRRPDALEITARAIKLRPAPLRVAPEAAAARGESIRRGRLPVGADSVPTRPPNRARPVCFRDRPHDNGARPAVLHTLRSTSRLNCASILSWSDSICSAALSAASRPAGASSARKASATAGDVNLPAADLQAPLTAFVTNGAARAIITGRRIATPVIDW